MGGGGDAIVEPLATDICVAEFPKLLFLYDVAEIESRLALVSSGFPAPCLGGSLDFIDCNDLTDMVDGYVCCVALDVRCVTFNC